jgi:hypothetical protein
VSISPPAAVLLMAPAKVLQGAVRLQGFTSSPTPDTQVRVAWPKLEALPSRNTAREKQTPERKREAQIVFIARAL